MDREARARLMEVIAAQAGGGEIVVPLDLFFDGNDDPGSIGCNLGASQPSISEFHRVLQALRSRPEVQDVLVRIYEHTDVTSWPFSDTVYVIATLPKADVEEAISSLQADEVVDGWMYGKPDAAPEPRDGYRPFSVWWD